jgi:Rieske Fe-S protein
MNDVVQQRLTKDAIPEAPVQDGMRRILAELVLVEKHCQHLGCLEV